jgi:nitrous oxidase accessory protein NosD
MFIVDDHGDDCPNAAFTTIQSAVDAAGPDDQIKVCPGEYTEQVRITGSGKDGLTLFSEVPLAATIKAPAAMTAPNSIVLVDEAEDVTIRQFTIEGPFVGAGCALPEERHTGVRIGNGSATLFGNHITEIRNAVPALYGCQDGIAVQVGRRLELQAGAATLRNNLIDRYQKGGVVVDGEGSSALITQNEVAGDRAPAISAIIAQNGIQISRAASAHVHHNLVHDNFFCCNGSNDAASGILLFSTSASVTVDHNVVRDNGIGIALFEVTSMLVDHNDVTGNRNDGVAAYNGSADNTISYNHITGNVPVDCRDDTTGPGTAATANYWIKDMGLTESRPGLCKRPPS